VHDRTGQRPTACATFPGIERGANSYGVASSPYRRPTAGLPTSYRKKKKVTASVPQRPRAKSAMEGCRKRKRPKLPLQHRSVCGSDRVSEALHAPYPRDNRARESSLPIWRGTFLPVAVVMCAVSVRGPVRYSAYAGEVGLC
jgi:hypothetical protein